jgi:predicted O-linked N-acetylglucosamine transferase (SPINDLY family)
LEQHLRTLASVDLALDSFPYQGTMTSLECLSVGTPIVSCCGDYYAHRATSAMMMRMGLFELIASDTDEYIEIAVQLLYDLPSLRAMRQVVDERFRSSPLTDPAGLTRELESHFTDWAS